MTLLSIECSGSPLSVAVQHEGRASLRVQNEPNLAAETIISLIDAALNELSVAVSQLDAVALTAGPGSFTSLRIGMSTAKGLCFALDKPLIMIPTLPAMATAVSALLPHTQTDFLVPLIHSKADDFFFNLFDRTSPAVPLLEHSYGTLPEIFAQVDQNRTIFIGRKLSRWPELKTVHTHEAADFNALSLLALAERKFDVKDFADVATAEPQYLKDFEAKKSTKKFFG